jgi:hypothetical protein
MNPPSGVQHYPHKLPWRRPWPCLIYLLIADVLLRHGDTLIRLLRPIDTGTQDGASRDSSACLSHRSTSSTSAVDAVITKPASVDGDRGGP